MSRVLRSASRQASKLTSPNGTAQSVSVSLATGAEKPPSKAPSSQRQAAGKAKSRSKNTPTEPDEAPRKRQKKASSPPVEGPPRHDEPKLDLLAGQHVLEEGEHQPASLPARPADPGQTNAMLETPRGTRITKYPKEALNTKSKAPPSETPVQPPSTDTNNLLKEGVAHLLRVEPKLQDVIDKHHCHIFSPEGLAESVDPFRSLTSSIMAQQVSGAAAAAIKKRFVGLFFQDEEAADASLDGKGRFPTPEQVAAKDIATLRSAGLSQRKAEYVQGLAEKFASGELSARLLIDAPYDEVLEKLVAVRGLGRWSVEMFACFGLKRMDIFSTGDLGVQRGMAAFQGRDVNKLKNKGGKWKYMSEQDMLDMSSRFAPYRSLFMWYMWRVEDVDVAAIQDA